MKMAWLPWVIDRDSLSYPSHVDMDINISTATRGKLHAPHIFPRWELIPCIWLQIWANFPPAPQVEFSLSNMYVRGTLCFLSQVEWTARDPDSKEGRISLQCLKFRLVFHLKIWRHVWIPCGDPREIHSYLPHMDRGNHITLIPREAHGIQVFKTWRCLTFLKMDRNPNITLPTRKWAFVSCLTSRSIRIVLPSLV